MNDVVVVGGGPAGSVTAMLLARAGHSVVLLEQHSFPRAKPCGDCISPGANAILDRIGVLNAIHAAGPAHLDGWKLSSENTAAFESRFGDGISSLAIERSRFDAILLDSARAAGVSVRTGARVTNLLHAHDGRVTGVAATVDSQPMRFEAGLTVGADGLRSRIARRLNAHRRLPRLRKISFTVHVQSVPGIGPAGEMHLAAGMCLGIAPVESGPDPMCNVTVVMPAPARGHTHETRGGPLQMLRHALKLFPHRDLTHLIADDTRVLASGPFDWPVRRVVHDGAVLVGDAAGYYDPFTGQGIYQALAGAELLAGQVILEDLRAYGRMHHDLLAPARRVQHAIEFVCARRALTRAAFGTLARTPRLARRLIQVTGDLRPARELLWFPS